MKTRYTALCALFMAAATHVAAQVDVTELESQTAPKQAPPTVTQPAPPRALQPTQPDMGLINPVAIGLRLSPDGGGITGKFFLSRDWVIEALVSGSQGFYHEPDNGPSYGASWSATTLGEYHFIFHDPSWRIYIGAGLHMGKWDKYNYASDEYEPQPAGIFGFDGIAGVEYIIKPVPIGISVDAKPAVNVISYPGFFPNNVFGVSVRYYFGRKVILRIENPEG